MWDHNRFGAEVLLTLDRNHLGHKPQRLHPSWRTSRSPTLLWKYKDSSLNVQVCRSQDEAVSFVLFCRVSSSEILATGRALKDECQFPDEDRSALLRKGHPKRQSALLSGKTGLTRGSRET